MTSPSADESMDRGDLDPDEADRLASLIRPVWEEDDAAAEDRSSAGGDRPSAESRSTTIDAIPNVDVGDTLPTDMELRLPPAPPLAAAGPSAAAESPGAAAAGATRPRPTRLGLGDAADAAGAPAAADPGPEAAVAPASASTTKMGLGTSEPPRRPTSTRI